MANGNKKTYNQAWSEMTDAEKKKRGYNIKGGKQKFIDQAKDYNRTQERKTKAKSVSSIKADKKIKSTNRAKLVESATAATNELASKFGKVNTDGKNVNVDTKRASSRNERKNQENDKKVKKLQAKYQKKRENKESRLNRRADRLAAKKGFGGYSDGSIYNSEGKRDNTKAMAARKEALGLMDERRKRGKQFFVDMAKAGVGSGDSSGKEPYSTKTMPKNFKEVIGGFKKGQDPTVITPDNTAKDVSNFDKSVKDAEALMQNTKIEAPGSSTASGLSNYLGGLNDNEFLNNKFLRYKAEDIK